MNDEELEKVYSRGHGVNHATGLREVYKAGRNHDSWALDQRRIERELSYERERVAAYERSRVTTDDRGRLITDDQGRVIADDRARVADSVRDTLDPAVREREASAPARRLDVP